MHRRIKIVNEGQTGDSPGPLTRSEIESLRQEFARDEAWADDELKRNPVPRPAWVERLIAKNVNRRGRTCA
jgi:hypothetical protein